MLPTEKQMVKVPKRGGKLAGHLVEEGRGKKERGDLVMFECPRQVLRPECDVASHFDDGVPARRVAQSSKVMASKDALDAWATTSS